MSQIQTFILIIVAIYLFITSILDIKYRFVYDYLTFFFAAVFIIIRILFAWQENDFSQLYMIIPYFVGTLIVSLVLYKFGHWGGGDLKLILALSIAIPFFPGDKDLNFFFNFLSNTLVGGLVYGIVYSVIKMVAEIKRLENVYSIKDSVMTFVTVAACVVLFFILNPLGKLLSVIAVLLPVVYLIKKAEDTIFIIDKKVSKLEPGDWILKDIKLGRGKIVTKKPTGLSKEDINLLQKTKKFKILKIRDGLPFVPSFFFGFLLTVFYGNIFLSLFQVVFTNI